MKLIFTAVCLASCAFAGDARPVASACGPDAVQFDVKTETPPQSGAKAEAGRALIYVITDIGVRGITTRVGLDGRSFSSPPTRSARHGQRSDLVVRVAHGGRSLPCRRPRL